MRISEAFNPFENCYQVLEISRAASLQEVKLAYRKLARQFHPDLNPDDQEAEARLKEVNAAYETLSQHLAAGNPPPLRSTERPASKQTSGDRDTHRDNAMYQIFVDALMGDGL